MTDPGEAIPIVKGSSTAECSFAHHPRNMAGPPAHTQLSGTEDWTQMKETVYPPMEPSQADYAFAATKPTFDAFWGDPGPCADTGPTLFPDPYGGECFNAPFNHAWEPFNGGPVNNSWDQMLPPPATTEPLPNDDVGNTTLNDLRSDLEGLKKM